MKQIVLYAVVASLLSFSVLSQNQSAQPVSQVSHAASLPKNGTAAPSLRVANSARSFATPGKFSVGDFSASTAAADFNLDGTTSATAALDFESVALGPVGTCVGFEGNVGTTCTATFGDFTFSFLSFFHVDDGTIFPNINNGTRFLVPNRIPELIPGTPPQIHPMVISFPATAAIEIDVFLGNPASHVLVEARDSLGFLVGSTVVTSDGTVRLRSAGNRIVALHLGVFVDTPRTAFAVDNLRLDTDGDGVPDINDNCPNSIVSPTIVIDGCDSGVPNTIFPSGCTISDLIAACAQGKSNHGGFVSCVSHLTNDLKEAGTITGQQKGAIQSCAARAKNPIEDRDYFVNQHYRDFLDRDADAGGLSYWSDRLASCGSDADCIRKRRIGVSAAFFVELEFQRTGSFVYRLYKGGLTRRPTYQEFKTDRAQVREGSTLESDKQALAMAFVQRNEFLIMYASSTDANSFISRLIESIQRSSNVNLQSQRTAILNRYNAGGNLNQSRAFALREAIDSTFFVDREYNAAFVLMQYFGYLKRDPDQVGYDFWLGIVNNPSLSNYRSMVCAFLTSAEYQTRFSSDVPRNDSECANIN